MTRILLMMLLLAIMHTMHAQVYYVVIGSFQTESAANNFANKVRNQQIDARIIVNLSRSLYYVYSLKTTDRKLAIERTIELQRNSPYPDAWMYTEIDASSTELVVQPEPSLPDLPPVVEQQKKKTEKVDVKKAAAIPEKEPELIIETEPRREPAPPEALVTEPLVTVPDEPEAPAKARGKFFIFQLSNTEGEPVNGRVYNVNPAQSRDLAMYQSNKRVDVLRPAIPGTPITIVCEIFGYKEVVVVLDFADPSTTKGVFRNHEGVWVVPLVLEPLRKGDISVMYDVTFYKDAIIMTPASEGELEELVNMMTANPNYKIKIHGHTNGNEKNLRIITPGTSGYYFGMSRTSSVTGSAKDLSRMRAEAIRNYLVEHGISKNRIDIYAWGGTAMLAKQGTAAAARINNRIEIEILDD